MADNIFDIEIITPDRVFYKGETDFLEFNTQNGEIGVYKKPYTAHDSACTGNRDYP